MWIHLSSTYPVLALMLPSSDAKSSVICKCVSVIILERNATAHSILCVTAGLLPWESYKNKYLSVVGPTLGFSVLHVLVLH